MKKPTKLEQIKKLRDALGIKEQEIKKEEAPSVKIEGAVEVRTSQKELAQMMSFQTSLTKTFVQFLSKLFTATIKVTQADEDYRKPQSIVIIDPQTGLPADLDTIFQPRILSQGMNISVGSGGASLITVKGSASLRGQTVTITTAGTRVQLPNLPCRSLLLQAHEGNASIGSGGVVVVGASDVVAASGSRNGIAIYATNSQRFDVGNANMLYVDATENGCKVTFTIESI